MASKLKEDNNNINKNAVVRNREIHHNLYAKISGEEKYLYEDIVSLLDMDIVEENEPETSAKEKDDIIPLI